MDLLDCGTGNRFEGEERVIRELWLECATVGVSYPTFFGSNFGSNLSSLHLEYNNIDMDRGSLDRSSSELAIDPVSSGPSTEITGNDPALSANSPQGPRLPSPPDDPLPAVENVLRSDVGSILYVAQ